MPPEPMIREDLVVAQPLGMRGERTRGRSDLVCWFLERAGGYLHSRLELLHLDEGWEQFADVVGPLGAARHVLFQTRPLAPPQPRLERLGQLLDGISPGAGAVAHHRNSSTPPGSRVGCVQRTGIFMLMDWCVARTLQRSVPSPHGRNSSIPPGRAARISLSFRRARMYLLLAAES